MKYIIKKIIQAILTISLFQINPVFSMELAITVDDLPANSELYSHDTRLNVAKKMLAVFKKHHITGIYGLINAGRVMQIPERFAVLEEWIKEGHFLGNHTYNHLDLDITNADKYILDIKKNEPILSQLMLKKDYHYFRYPYLSEGNTQEKRDTVLKFLLNSGYKIAPVTVDFFDYKWNDPYVRCLNKQDENSIEWLKKTYIEQAKNALIISHSLAEALFKRDIKNILLIHINSFTAEMLDELLTNFEKQNIKFISLSEALSDDVYKTNPYAVSAFLNQVRLSKEVDNPDIVIKLRNSLPNDKLKKLCE